MTDTQKATAIKTEERLMSTWTRAAEQVFERLTHVKPELQWESEHGADLTSEDRASLEWWEAQFEAEENYHVWLGVPEASEVELRRLAHALATADERAAKAESLAVKETTESLCDAFGELLSREVGRAIQYRGLTRLETPPAPEALYSTEIALPEGSVLPILVGFSAEMRTSLGQLIEQSLSGPTQRRADPDESSSLGPLLELELPLSVRFGQAQLPLERVLELQVGSVLDLDGLHDDPVDLLVNGSVVARGEVVAVDGNYGVRILEVLRGNWQRAASRRGS